MGHARRWTDQRWTRAIVALAVGFLVLDLAAYASLVTLTTAEREAIVREFPSEIRDVDRSKLGYSYIMTSDHLYRAFGSRLYTYAIKGEPTSMSVGTESDTLAVVSDERFLEVFPTDTASPYFIKDMKDRTTIIALSEKGGAHGYAPKNVYCLVEENGTTRLSVIGALTRGEPVYHYDFPGSITSYARPGYLHFLAFAIDDGTVLLYRETNHTMRGLDVEGDLAEIFFSPESKYLGILYDRDGERRLRVYDPMFDREVSDHLLPADAKSLRFQDEGSRIYFMSEGRVMRLEGGAISTCVTSDGMDGFIMPSVADYIFTFEEGCIAEHLPGTAIPKWRCQHNVGDAVYVVDASGTTVIGHGGSEFIIIDNSKPAEGSPQGWSLLSALLGAEIVVLVLLSYLRTRSKFNNAGILALLLGAMVGILVAGFVHDDALCEWFGSDMAYLVINGIVAGIVSLYIWDQQIGAYTILLGAFYGLPLGALSTLVATILIMNMGWELPGSQDTMLLVAGYGMALGFRMGLAGGCVGMLLGIGLHPRGAVGGEGASGP